MDTSSAGNKTITYTAPADAAGNVPDSKRRIVRVLFSPFNVMTGKTVSIVTNEPSVMSLSEITTRPSLEFKASIENVTFPFVSPDKTVVVNVALPPDCTFKFSSK